MAAEVVADAGIEGIDLAVGVGGAFKCGIGREARLVFQGRFRSGLCASRSGQRHNYQDKRRSSLNPSDHKFGQ